MKIMGNKLPNTEMPIIQPLAIPTKGKKNLSIGPDPAPTGSGKRGGTIDIQWSD